MLLMTLVIKYVIRANVFYTTDVAFILHASFIFAVTLPLANIK